MAKLSALFAGVLIVWPGCADADPVDRWAEPVAEASLRFGIPQDWIFRVMRIESGGRTLVSGRPVVSRAGAMGLMQLMPGTWRDMRALLGLGFDPFDPRDNILAGTAYLRAMYDRFGYPGLFAAYHAGPARYSAYLSTGRRLPAETRIYVAAAARLSAAPSRVTAKPGAIFAPAAASLSANGLGPIAPSGTGGLFVLVAPDRRKSQLERRAGELGLGF